MPEKSLAEHWEGRYADLQQLTDRQLADLQTSKSEWHARRARVILQSRAANGKLAGGLHEQLRNIYSTNSNPDWRLRAMWTLHITGGFQPEDLNEALKSKDEYIRAWAIQFLCEDKTPSQTALAEFIRMAEKDGSPVVRLYLASAIQRVDKNSGWKIAEALTAHAEDANDHNLPHMIWFGLEPLIAADPEKGLKLASESRIPLIAQYAARRAVDADATDRLIAVIENKPKTLVHLLEGMRDALEGRNDLTAPTGWPEVYKDLMKSEEKVAVLGREISQLFGDTEAARQSLATLMG
jgi:hypothetical protein